MKHYLLKTTLRLLLTVVMVYLLPMTAWGQGRQPNGDGNNEGSAYQISERAHLEWMAEQVETGSNTFEGKFFKLQNDIDLSDAPWTTPIGSNGNYNKFFAGVFDGDGWKISGLTIPPSTNLQYLGLFGVVGKSDYSSSDIIIKNLAVEIAEEGIGLNPNNGFPTANSGGIAGYATKCTIENCYVTGGSIHYEGEARNKYINAGGITYGGSSATIKNCYATIDISITNINAIYESYGNGVKISGISSQGTITNCFYSGKLTVNITSGDNDDFDFKVGGISENDYQCGTSNNLVLSRENFTLTTPRGQTAIKAICSAPNSGNVNNNYVSPGTTLNGVKPTYNGVEDGTLWDNTADAAAPISTWLSSGNWKSENERFMPILLTTTGTEFHSPQPVLIREIKSISTAAELAAINTSTTTLNKDYILTNDIDLTGYNSNKWTPIGSTATPFKGIFNGNGHIIEGLNAERTDQTGLFGVIESGTVENLGVKFGTLKSTGESYALVGGIAGEIKDNSTIQNCYTTGGSIITNSGASDNAGGGIIAKGTQSTILNCYSICNINLDCTLSVNGGGIAGYGKNLTVSNCYSICKIKGISGGDGGGGNSVAGGIVGSVSSIYNQPADQSSITNCLAISKEEFDLTNTDGYTNFFPGRILGKKGYNSNATLTGNYATPLMPGSWTTIGADQNDGGDWNGANCTPSDPAAWDTAWDDMTTTNRAIIGPNLPKLNTTGGTPINGQDDDIDKLLYIGFKLTTTADANGTIEVKSTPGDITYNNGDYIPANTELTITAKPNSSYKTASLKVSGSNFTSGSSYIVGSDLATKGTDLTVEATFAITHTVTVDAAIVNGSIEVKKSDGTTLTPGANTVEEGTVLTITATPATGYQLKQLTADGNPSNGNTYTVTGDVTLSAEFEAKSGGGNEGDGGGSTTPTVYHTVTLPAVEGATTDPVAGDYEVEAWGSFRFYLTLDKEYDKSEPVITTDRGETIQPRSSDGAYIVKYVRSDVQILIDSIIKNPDPVGNETVTANQSKVWAAEGYLHIEAGTDGQAYIFTADGRLQKLQPVTTGQAIALPLPEGVYLVRIGDERFKVLL